MKRSMWIWTKYGLLKLNVLFIPIWTQRTVITHATFKTYALCRNSFLKIKIVNCEWKKFGKIINTWICYQIYCILKYKIRLISYWQLLQTSRSSLNIDDSANRNVRSSVLLFSSSKWATNSLRSSSSLFKRFIWCWSWFSHSVRYCNGEINHLCKILIRS